MQNAPELLSYLQGVVDERARMGETIITGSQQSGAVPTLCAGVLRLLQPYHRNWGKRLVKTPKLYFLDTGLLCHLLRIDSPQTLGSAGAATQAPRPRPSPWSMVESKATA